MSELMDLRCKGIKIEQRLEKGILSGPHLVKIDFRFQNENFKIAVEQRGNREIEINCDVDIDGELFLSLFDEVDTLLMLLEGKFIPVVSCQVLNEERYVNSDSLSKLILSRTRMYCSAEYTRGTVSTFADYDKCFSAELLTKWHDVRQELDLLHQMTLYAVSDAGMPIDVKCAYLIEVYEGLAELISKHNKSFQLPKVKNGESRLGKYLDAVIETYGRDIFDTEMAVNRQNFIKLLVDSRNRIAHIKSRQGKKYLNGEESVLYTVKLSFLYRKVILELLGIDYATYSDKLKSSVDIWNKWNDVLKNLKMTL